MEELRPLLAIVGLLVVAVGIGLWIARLRGWRSAWWERFFAPGPEAGPQGRRRGPGRRASVSRGAALVEGANRGARNGCNGACRSGASGGRLRSPDPDRPRLPSAAGPGRRGGRGDDTARPGVRRGRPRLDRDRGVGGASPFRADPGRATPVNRGGGRGAEAGSATTLGSPGGFEAASAVRRGGPPGGGSGWGGAGIGGRRPGSPRRPHHHHPR